MRAQNPFTERQTLRIDEAAPPRTCARADIRAIVIGPARGRRSLRASRGRADARTIGALLASIRRPARVRIIEIDYDSALRRVPNLDGLREIEYAHIGGRRIKDYGPLHGLRQLKKLVLVNYSESSLRGFPRSSLEWFRAIRGRLEALVVRTKFALIQDCSRLRDLSGSSIDSLILESCRAVSFPTLSKIRRLRSLQILGCSGLKDFDWIRGCSSLEHLVVTAIPFSRVDLEGLVLARPLRRCYLAASDEVIAEASRLTDAAVSNGRRWYRRGAPGNGPDPLLNDG